MSAADEDGPFFIPLRGGADRPAPQRAAKPERPADATRLTLARAGKTAEGEWSADDYDVLEGHRLIGRITLRTQTPQGMPWFWMITARPDSAQNRGYAVSREQALKELRARWANPSKF